MATTCAAIAAAANGAGSGAPPTPLIFVQRSASAARSQASPSISTIFASRSALTAGGCSTLAPGAGRTGIGAGRAKLPGIAQGSFVLAAAGEPHAGSGAFQRQSLPLGTQAGCARGKRVEQSQGGASPEGGVTVAGRAAQAGTAGFAAGPAVAGSRRIMISRVKPVRFVPRNGRFQRAEAQKSGPATL